MTSQMCSIVRGVASRSTRRVEVGVGGVGGSEVGKGALHSSIAVAVVVQVSAVP